MGLITWSEDLSVQIEEVDEQHKQLIEYINDLNDALLAGHGQDALGRILDGLISYTVMHFGMEEKYFDKFAYVERIAHKQEYDDFVREVLEKKRAFDGGNTSIPGDILRFLYGWLIKHIKSSDKRYVACFHHNGVS